MSNAKSKALSQWVKELMYSWNLLINTIWKSHFHGNSTWNNNIQSFQTTYCHLLRGLRTLRNQPNKKINKVITKNYIRGTLPNRVRIIWLLMKQKQHHDFFRYITAANISILTSITDDSSKVPTSRLHPRCNNAHNG